MAENSLPVGDAYDVDYIGTGTFQVSQKDVLQRRSIDLIKTSESQLSARGLQHRTRAYFSKDVREASAILEQAFHEQGTSKTNKKKSHQMFQTYFQRALGFERLGKLEKAIKDYTSCIEINENIAASYFNRGGIYYFQGKLDEALTDMNSAVKHDPTNIAYRTNRALIERRVGNFDRAINDTIMMRALQLNPSLFKDNAGSVDESVPLDSDALLSHAQLEDPIRVCLRQPKGNRSLDSNFLEVCKFISSLKMFRGIVPEQRDIVNIAQYLGLIQVEAGQLLFDEGDICDYFYIVFEGLIGIIKKLRVNDRNKSNTLVQLASGQSFGDANLERQEGKRTAGAVAVKRSTLLTLSAADYTMVMSGYRRSLTEEVKRVISTCPVFRTWDEDSIDKLSESAIRRSYNAGSVILEKGDPARSLYIIIRGVVKLVKPIPRPAVKDINVRTLYDVNEVATSTTGLGSEPPGLWVRELNFKDRLDIDEKAMKDIDGNTVPSAEFTVGVLGSGQVFGELAILSPERDSPYSVISFTDVELHCFDSDTVTALGCRFNANTMNTLNESLNLHNPPSEKINHYFRSKYAWEKKKESILKLIGQDRPSLLQKLHKEKTQKKSSKSNQR